MQFRDLKAQYWNLKAEIDDAMLGVVSDCNFIGGKQVKELEEGLASYVGVKHCITCANGTDALTMAMMAWGVGKGDAVFVPDFTFFSSGEVVSHCGATPIFVDVNEKTFNIDCESLEKAIKIVSKEGKLNPKAVIAVDLFGLPAEFDNLKEIAEKYNLLLLEDGAQGFGGHIADDNGSFKRACSFGDIATTSFFPAKPLGCYGDGGAVFTDSDEWADVLRSIAVHGKGAQKYDNIRIGMNSRLDAIQAAILKVKFKAFVNYELEDVNKVARWYNERLSDVVRTPGIADCYFSSWAQYTIKLKNRKSRDILQTKLKEHDIPSAVYYSKPMHEQAAFGGDGTCMHYVTMMDYSITERLCNTVLSLPMHPYLSEKDVEIVCTTIKEYLYDM